VIVSRNDKVDNKLRNLVLSKTYMTESSKEQQPPNALEKYYQFVSKDPNRWREHKVVKAAGGYDRMKQQLHVDAALQIMEEEDIGDFYEAKKRVAAIVQEWFAAEDQVDGK
jgi:hypothetical protein